MPRASLTSFRNAKICTVYRVSAFYLFSIICHYLACSLSDFISDVSVLEIILLVTIREVSRIVPFCIKHIAQVSLNKSTKTFLFTASSHSSRFYVTFIFHTDYPLLIITARRRLKEFSTKSVLNFSFII